MTGNWDQGVVVEDEERGNAARGKLVDPTVKEIASDVLQSTGSGIVSGAATAPGVLGDLYDLSAQALLKLGFTPDQARTIRSAAVKAIGSTFTRGASRGEEFETVAKAAPRSADTQAFVRRNTDLGPLMDYQPQTGLGEVGKVGGQFAIGALMPGGVAARLGAVAGPTAGHFAGGELAAQTLGEDYRQAGEIVGGLAGGAVPGVRGRAAPTAAAEEIRAAGITPRVGEMTGDVNRQIFELEAAQGARGEAARRVMADAEAQRGQELARAAARVVDETQPVQPGMRPPTAAAGVNPVDDVTAALQREAVSRERAAAQSFDRANQLGLKLDASAMPQILPRIDRALGEMGITSLDGYRTAQQARNIIERRLGELEAHTGGAPGAMVPLKNFEGVHREINRLKPARGDDADYSAVATIRRTMDEFRDDLVNAKLYSGDPKAVEELKNAKSLWTSFKSLTEPGGALQKATYGERTVADAIAEGRTPAQMSELLLGAASAGAAGRAKQVVDVLKRELGENSPAFMEYRRALSQRVLTPSAVSEGRESTNIAQRIADFLDGNGRDLSRAVFSDREIGRMRQFRQRLLALEPSAQAQRYARGAAGGGAGAGVSAIGSGLSTIAAVSGLMPHLTAPAAALLAAPTVVRGVRQLRAPARARAAVSGRMPRAPYDITQPSAAALLSIGQMSR